MAAAYTLPLIIKPGLITLAEMAAMMLRQYAELMHVADGAGQCWPTLPRPGTGVRMPVLEPYVLLDCLFVCTLTQRVRFIFSKVKTSISDSSIYCLQMLRSETFRWQSGHRRTKQTCTASGRSADEADGGSATNLQPGRSGFKREQGICISHRFNRAEQEAAQGRGHRNVCQRPGVL
jgi:hypothetical protein